SVTENTDVSVFDGQYNKLDVIIEPSKVDVSINVEENKKEVPLYLNTIGELESDYQLDGAKLKEDTITIYGEQSVLDEINEVYAELDLKDVGESGSFNTQLNLPNNISKTEPKNEKEELKKRKKKEIIMRKNLGLYRYRW